MMLVVLGFFVLFDLTMILSISGNPYTIAFILIYIVLLPLWTIIRHAHIYFIVLPVPYLGSWLMSIIYLSSFALPVLQASILVSIIPVTLATMVHIFSRTRNMLGRISMTSFSRTAFAVASAIFFTTGLVILGSKPIEFNDFNKSTLFAALSLAYISASMIYVNSAYRYRVICKKLGANRIERKLSSIWDRIDNRFSEQRENVDLLRYYFLDALHLFEEGNYEMAFITGYKVINEETVVDPKKYISDKREGEPSSFSEIRTILMHSRSHRKEVQINVKRIRETKRKLPRYCIELLQRSYTFLEKLY